MKIYIKQNMEGVRNGFIEYKIMLNIDNKIKMFMLCM